jgi:hypothetical protein
MGAGTSWLKVTYPFSPPHSRRLDRGHRLPTQPLHVYRHVDIANLQSKAEKEAPALISRVARAGCRLSKPSLLHEKATKVAQRSNGGKTWIG